MNSKENSNSTLVVISPAQTKPFFFVLEFVLENQSRATPKNDRGEIFSVICGCLLLDYFPSFLPFSLSYPNLGVYPFFFL